MLEVILNLTSEGEQKQVPVTADGLTIGRSSGSSVVVADDGGLSRYHAAIHREGDEVRLVDEQSANGSYVNCALVPPEGTRLADGDEIFMGNHTVMTVSIRAASRRTAGSEGRTNGVAIPVLFIAPIVVVALLIGANAARNMGHAGAGDRQFHQPATPVNTDATGPGRSQQDVVGLPPAPAPKGSPEDSILSSGEPEQREAISETPNGPRKLYKSMTDEEKRDFIKERAGRIAIMMGKRPYTFTPDALGYIKFWLEAFAGRVGNNRTGLWRGDTKFILERGRVQAPLIIHAFKENRVPPVIGLYIPFIETEYNNIQSNNGAGAAGLFQFLGPTAEHYGVPSSERTNVARMAPAAARYFRDNIMSFGDDSMSVALAIAGYNRAPESVKRDLRNVLSANSNEDKERNFWTLVANQGKLDQFFQNENKNYVPRFFAAAIIGETPWAFGIEMRPLSTYTVIGDQPPAESPNTPQS